jgi:hypothetical protein
MSYLRKDTVIPWPALQAQFGADYALSRQFKAAFLVTLRKVLTIYSGAKVIAVDNGLALKPSVTHIPR